MSRSARPRLWLPGLVVLFALGLGWCWRGVHRAASIADSGLPLPITDEAPMAVETWRDHSLGTSRPAHRERIAEAEPAAMPDDPLARADALVERATAHFEDLRFDEAQADLRAALILREGRLGYDHSAVADVLDQLARVLRYAGTGLDDAEEARRSSRRSLAIREALVGPMHPDRIPALVSLATLTSDRGEAEELLRQAVDIGERSYGFGDLELVEPLEATMRFLAREQRVDEAIAVGERALALVDAASSASTAGATQRMWLRHELAGLYARQGYETDAERVHLEARKIEVDLGHDGSSSDLMLVKLYRRTGRLSEAEETALRVLARLEAKAGSDHVSLTVALEHLAPIQRAQGRADDAERTYRRILSLMEATTPGRKPTFHHTWRVASEGLEEILREDGRTAEADALRRDRSR